MISEGLAMGEAVRRGVGGAVTFGVGVKAGKGFGVNSRPWCTADYQ